LPNIFIGIFATPLEYVFCVVPYVLFCRITAILFSYFLSTEHILMVLLQLINTT